MELRNRVTGDVLTEQQFRASHPNTSFPDILTVDVIDGFGYDPVLEGPQAETTPPYQFSQRDGVVEVKGQWFTHYVVGPIFQDYTDDDGVVHSAAEQYKAYCVAMDDEQAGSVRTDRNRRLSDCDWTQGRDIPDSIADPWASYRRALREIPEQEGFPWDVSWPEPPSA